MKAFLAVLVVVLAGCAHPPQITTAFDVQKKSDDMVIVKIKITNLEDRATTPLNVEITGQARSGGAWTKSESILHPAAFVLNKKEQREITKFWKIQADAVRTTVVVKEQETGNVLKSEKLEKTLPPPPPAPAS